MVLAALTMAALLGDVRTAGAADKWMRVRSRNFLVVGSASEARLKQVAGELERFRAAFAVLFPAADRKATSDTTVIVFRNDSAFRPFKPVYEGKPANVSGYFQSGGARSFIALNGDVDTPSLIYHEFVHALSADATQRLPAWVSEGLAEFYSTFRSDPDGRNVELGRPVDQHIVLLRQNQLIPLNTLLAVDHQSSYYNEQSKQGIFYAESWALVHYLANGANGGRRLQLADYLSLIASGKPIEDSFREAFHADYADIEKELRQYLTQFTMTFFRVRLSEKLDIEKAIETAPVSEAQAAAYLGDMMVHMGRADAAERELARAIALDPALAGSYVSMGMLRLRENKQKEALEFLSKAIDNDSRDPFAHLTYAQLLATAPSGESADRRRDRLEMMRVHVKVAIEISPHLADAYRLLTFVAVSLQTELLETETAVAKAVDLAPGREDLRIAFAGLMALNGKVLAARTVASEVRNTTTKDDIRRQADVLLDALRAQIESAQALRDYQARQKAAGLPEDPSQAPASTAGTAASSAAPPSPGPAERGGLGDAVRPTKRMAGPQVDGFLSLIDCARGMNLYVQTTQGPVVLHSDMPSRINFISYLPTPMRPVVCGAVTPPSHVIVVYGKATDPAYIGEPLSVEFWP
jgi:tetratricopeptide (TPR) repeat protein